MGFRVPRKEEEWEKSHGKSEELDEREKAIEEPELGQRWWGDSMVG